MVGRLSQQIASPNPATLIGEGKVEELHALLEAERGTLVLFDEELTPNQGANLEKELKVRVMDRSELILDIFSTRARTHEAKLQVELAQLEYLLPRLARMWTHLSRIRGGIGLRGPGETQLETDRRMIRREDPAAAGEAARVGAAPRGAAGGAVSRCSTWRWWATPTPASRACSGCSRASTTSSWRTGSSRRSTP